jgi:prophage tail gpP-like protein
MSLGDVITTLQAVGQPAIPDDVTLAVGSQRIAGWTRVRITRGIERLPSEFDIEFTEYYPGANATVSVLPGAPCRVYIGADLMLTGYVDRYLPSLDADQHLIRVTGRGKCQDLVDSSAEWEGGQISGTSALDVAAKLAEPYGITVTAPDGPGLAIPQFNLMFGETAAEIIDRIARFSALLYYDGPDGNLILSQVGTTRAASGFAQGVNVERASASFTMDQRFSEYKVMMQSMAALGDFGGAGDLQASTADPQVPRHREKFIVCEAGFQGIDLAQKRAIWEAKRRFGRSFQLSLTTDGWRDAAGRIWTPNSSVPISLPALKMNNLTWVIGEVTFLRDDKGTRAEISLMPPDAFTVEPILIQQQPLVEAGATLSLPGGATSPATPGLPAPASSPAKSPASSTMTDAERAATIIDIFGGGDP